MDIRIHQDGSNLAEQIIGRNPVPCHLRLIVIQHIYLGIRPGKRVNQAGNPGGNQTLEQRQHQPYGDTGQSSRGCVPADHGKEFRPGQPQTDIHSRQQKINHQASHLLPGGNQSGNHHAEPCGNSSDGKDHDGNRCGSCQKLCVNNRISVNRLRRQAVQGSLSHLLVDGVKAQHNSYQRSQKSDKRREGINITAGSCKQLQKNKL